MKFAKTKICFVALCAMTSLAFGATIEQRLADVEDRLDDVEFNTGLDRIKFGLDFSTGVSESWYNVPLCTTTTRVGCTTAAGVGADNKYKAHNKWGMELHLNMNATINSYTKFYGRLSVAKNYGMMDTTNFGTATDYEAGRNPSKSFSNVYLSRAYVDFFITPEIVATIGRQPGTDGPGSNLRNNALRQSTYPALLINALGDAAVLSYKPKFARQLQFVVRGAYGKIYQYDKESGQVEDWISSKETADTNLWYASFEIQPYLGALAKQSLFMVSWARLHDFALNLNDAETSPQTPTVVFHGVQNLGTIDSVNAHFESYQAFSLPLSYFISASYMKGSNAKNVIPSSVSNGEYTALPNNARKIFNEESAYAVHAGLRYDFHRYFKLGGEYFYGSKYWFTMTGVSFNDPLNIRATRGHAYDVYVISQIDRNQFLRLSYTHIQNKWTNRGTPAGDPLSKDDVGGYESSADSVMLVYNVKF